MGYYYHYNSLVYHPVVRFCTGMVAVAAGGADVTGAFNARTAAHYSLGCKVGEHACGEHERERDREEGGRSPRLVRAPSTCESRQVHQSEYLWAAPSDVYIAYITRLSTQVGPSPSSSPVGEQPPPRQAPLSHRRTKKEGTHGEADSDLP